MTEQALHDKAWIENPYTWKNTRGSVKTQRGYLTFGLPPPPHGRKEDPNAKKGGDRIGFRQVVITPEMVGQTVAVFLSIELKTANDRLAEGQINWHNWLLEQGAISEIWRESNDGRVCKSDARIDPKD